MSSPAAFINAGSVFGRFTTTGVVERRNKYIYQEVRCSCGVVKFVEQTNLRKGVSKSCGCLNAELSSARSTTHGKSKSPLYAVWNMMKQRCTVPTYRHWADYGGRGITVCDRWLEFENFYADMGDPPFKRASVERKDTNKGYYPENCIWADRDTQNNNTRKSVRFTVNGEELTLKEMAERSGINQKTLSSRIYIYGMTAQEAFTAPVLAPKESGGLPKSLKAHKGRIDGYKLYSQALASEAVETSPEVD